ncbi:MAG: hypothetical protein ABL950_14010, partial [Nitrospira sp.]
MVCPNVLDIHEELLHDLRNVGGAIKGNPDILRARGTWPLKRLHDGMKQASGGQLGGVNHLQK